jgi:hypothetical protein
MSFRIMKQALSYQIAGHLSLAPYEVTCRNQEQHKNVEGAGNIDFSASSNAVHLSLNQNVCKRRI